ncbi:MAG: hypothetical protein C0391_01460 [Anaerolinea sp.]|nr:hypothetical protein [Anaerolinea sp.]
MRRDGSNLFVLTALVLGLGLGLLVSLALSPVEMRNISPAMLSAADKDIYRALIAKAYTARGDLGRAQARLALLEDADMRSALAAQAQQSIAQGRPADESRSLALLAAALGSTANTSTPVTEPVVTSTPATEPVNTSTSSAPAPAPAPQSFVIKTRENTDCDVEHAQLLQVTVLDAAGKPLPGAGITISWEGGEETFFTGLKPRVNPGYADFRMEPGVLYNLRMASGGQTATNISAPNCRTDAGMEYKGGVVLVFGLK